jgi:lycopene beta-cyclase
MARAHEHRPEAEFDVVFVGGGLTSALACLAALARQPRLRLAVVEREPRLGGNHTWCFHAADVPGAARAFVEPLIVQRWEGYSVHFPRRSRRLASPYACISSERLHEVVSARLSAAAGSELVLGKNAARLTPEGVLLDDGRWLRARLVIDARGPTLADQRGADSSSEAPMQGFAGTARGYQKFVGLELRVLDHSLREPVIFDACLPQHDGFRFMYTLPLSPRRLLVEETFFSDTPGLDQAQSQLSILAYARAQGYRVSDVLRSERGVLPMPWQDRDFDPHARPLVAGYRGGLFHPVTGYSLPMAVRFALALAASDLTQLETRPNAPSPLSDFARAQAAQRPFLRLLTRLLFTGFASHERYSVLSHFYRLPEAIIERFYAGELRTTDRARVFLGAPPRGFSITRALGLSALGPRTPPRAPTGATS